MATLQKFKLFATQCAAVNIPTQSPTTSPLLLRRRPRRKTLRMLLTRRPQISDSDHQSSSLNNPPPTQPSATASSINRRLKLKELFFSSPTAPSSSGEIGPVRSEREIIIRPKAVRPVYQPFGYRNKMLLRKAWRPVLTTIDEIQD